MKSIEVDYDHESGLRFVLQARCLGELALRTEHGRIAVPPPKKGGEFLMFMLVHARAPASCAALADALWPDLDGELVSHRLHIAASGARAALRGGFATLDPLRSIGAAYAWHPSVRVETDVDRLCALGDLGTLEAARAGVALYEGELFAGGCADWMLPLRVRCESIHADMLWMLAMHAFDESEFTRALGFAMRLVDIDRGHEAATRLAMRCLAALGRRARVLSEYHALKRYLERRLSVEPMEETTALMHALIGDTPGPARAESTAHA